MTQFEAYPNPEIPDNDMVQNPEIYTRAMNSLSIAALVGGVSLSYLHNKIGGDPFVSSTIATAGTWFTIMPQWMRKDRMNTTIDMREKS